MGSVRGIGDGSRETAQCGAKALVLFYRLSCIMSNTEKKEIMQAVLVVRVDRSCSLVGRSLSAEATNWPS